MSDAFLNDLKDAQIGAMPEDAIVTKQGCFLTCPGCRAKDNKVARLFAHPFFQFAVCVVCLEFSLDKGRLLRSMKTQYDRTAFNWSELYCRVCGNGWPKFFQCGKRNCPRGICKVCADQWYRGSRKTGRAVAEDNSDGHPSHLDERSWRCPECVQRITGNCSVLCKAIQTQQQRDILSSPSGAANKGWPSWVQPRGDAQGKQGRHWEEAEIMDVYTKKLCLAFINVHEPYFKRASLAGVKKSGKRRGGMRKAESVVIPPAESSVELERAVVPGFSVAPTDPAAPLAPVASDVPVAPVTSAEPDPLAPLVNASPPLLPVPDHLMAAADAGDGERDAAATRLCCVWQIAVPEALHALALNNNNESDASIWLLQQSENGTAFADQVIFEAGKGVGKAVCAPSDQLHRRLCTAFVHGIGSHVRKWGHWILCAFVHACRPGQPPPSC